MLNHWPTFTMKLHFVILQISNLNKLFVLFTKMFANYVKYIFSSISSSSPLKNKLPLHCGVWVGQNNAKQTLYNAYKTLRRHFLTEL